MTKNHLIIATRESKLALYQAEWIKERLLALHPQLSVELLGITTTADKRLDVSLLDIGGKGLFVKELEEALLGNKADIAVHSMKDVPMHLPEGLDLPVICEREDARDVLISNHYQTLLDLPNGAKIGTSSLRRQTQLRVLRPDLVILPLRGNIQTRLQKLDSGEFDAIILAAAGLKRLQIAERISDYFAIEDLLPAAGQGALGIECREGDEAIQKLIQPLLHAATFAAVTAERALCRYLEAGCQLPLAAYAHYYHHSDDDQLLLNALLANSDGSRILRAKQIGHTQDADLLGCLVGKALREQGADQILRSFL
jgi:hydroxymethylbilane synthase